MANNKNVGKNELRFQLSELLNKHCAENTSNTPDFILAQYMIDCLEAFEKASLAREKWYGTSLSVKNNEETIISKEMSIETARGIAARIWCDHDYKYMEMNAEVAEKIAVLIKEEADFQEQIGRHNIHLINFLKKEASNGNQESIRRSN